MRKINKPTEDSAAFFILCISTFREATRLRLLTCEPDIRQSALDFESKISTDSLHTFPTETHTRDIPAKQMIKVYTEKMASKNKPGRSLYDKILSSPKLGICPLCLQRTVSTLDHHLPKAHYPIFSVIPVNLIPACAECNKLKKDVILTSPKEATIHPYYDEIENDRWLFASVIENPLVINFNTLSHPSWSVILGERVDNHFTLFKLSQLYSVHSAVQLSTMKLSLQKLHAVGGFQAVKNYLIDSAASSSSAHINSWSSALYEALYKSTWFCNGGFESI